MSFSASLGRFISPPDSCSCTWIVQKGFEDELSYAPPSEFCKGFEFNLPLLLDVQGPASCSCFWAIREAYSGRETGIPVPNSLTKLSRWTFLHRHIQRSVKNFPDSHTNLKTPSNDSWCPTMELLPTVDPALQAPLWLQAAKALVLKVPVTTALVSWHPMLSPISSFKILRFCFEFCISFSRSFSRLALQWC